MRKYNLMKIIITTICTMFLVSIAHSQEKQNDATIEETINWLNEYGVKNMIDFKDSFRKPYGFEMNNNRIHYKYDSGNKVDDVKNVFFEKGKISKMLINVYDGKYSISVEEKSAKMSTGFFYFGFNKEYALKTYKAFEHLFYLLEWEVNCVNKLVDENKF